VANPASTFATPRVAAGALFLDPAGRVLLVRPIYKATWDIPGGYVEQGESPAAACRREVAEELGLDRQPRRLLAVDWAPHEGEGDKLLFLFDCGDLAGDEHSIELDPDELDAWRWVDVEELGNFLIPRLARRIRATVEDSGSSAAYLEHGEVPASNSR
jgi:8-oxo-dGTP diphosphatase